MNTRQQAFGPAAGINTERGFDRMTAAYELSTRAAAAHDVDVLVLGGGMSGVFAAVAASKAGASVVIVEPSNVLGGQGTSGGVAGFVGDTGRVNDLFRELVDRLEVYGKIDPYRPNDDRRAYDLESWAFLLQEFASEAGVEIWLHAAAIDVKREADVIGKVLVRCGPSLILVHPKVVIDATGNAIVADVAGAETVHLGPGKQLPMSLYFTLWNTGRPVEPFLPPGCPRWEDSDDLPMTSLHAFADGRIEVKMKVVGFDAADGLSLSKAEIHARRQMMGLIHHLQTRGYQGRHSFDSGRPLSTYTLASVSRAIGQREGRRIVGQFTLSDEDVRTACVLEDAVAVGTYHLDYHWTDTEKRAGTGVTDMVEPYHIPLRAMRPAGLENVLCPGRSLSGDQLALSSYRAMATCAQMGLGAGLAAALAVEQGMPLDHLDLQELKQRVTAAGQSLDLSDYGDYLRCLRVIDEKVPLPRRADGIFSLALCRAANGRTCAVRYDRETGEVGIAVRSRTNWHEAGMLEAARGAGLTGCAVGDDDRLMIELVFDDGTRQALPFSLDWKTDVPSVTGLHSPLSASALADRMPVRVRHVLLHFGPEGFPVGAEPTPESGPFTGTVLASCTFAQGTATLVACRSPQTPARTMLLALQQDLETTAIERYLVVDPDIDPMTKPAIVPTAVGIALLYDRAGGGARFFEGSIERFAPIGAPPPREEDLKAMPYADHVILAARKPF